ncbi:MAG: isoprenylcysteine carboxylmethyltransferase family protein [Candidatus Bathyarchaeota archaeon]|nr:MAG: isoprenylcysteine carboxylmethyltransferase family protein [Candidatus Bathyarchaeota archaeon]
MPRRNREFRVAAIKWLLLAYVMLTIQMLIFFISVGHVDGPRPWIFFGASFLYSSASIVVQYRLNPELLVQRFKTKREGSKLWDEILMRATNLTILIAVPTVAGFDIGRIQSPSLGVPFAVVGFVSFIISSILLNWAMTVNPHFEPTVRIQKDRGHKVVVSGPYKKVRHPGYLAAILFALSIPLTIGSILTLIPSGIYSILMMIRTSLEDRTLHKELDGYSEYAKRIRYRLFPGIW